MSTTFLIDDASSGGNNPTVQVTITDNGDGTFTFEIVQLVSDGAFVGDLRGFFFDIAQDGGLTANQLSISNFQAFQSTDLSGTAIPTLTSPTELQAGDDSVKNLADGANMLGLTGSDGGYDVGIEIGTQGIATNDVGSVSFTLQGIDGLALTMADFVNMDFGIRLTSVGQVDADGNFTGDRDGSSKILGTSDGGADVTFAVSVISEDPNNDASATTIVEQDANDDTGTFTIAMSGDALTGTNTASVTVTVSGTATDADFTLADGTPLDYTAIVAAIQAAATAASIAVSAADGDSLVLTWDASDPASFDVALTAFNDASAEGPEDLSLTLSDATILDGTAIITTDLATLNIMDIL